ncbi:MAG: transporter [Muribaculaceae bacterium]|nr:transporter [Muribaculaceae bacterium]
MNITAFQKKAKPWMMPLAMISGTFFHEAISRFEWIVPYLIFTMLFITFCRIRPSQLRISRMIWTLLAIQIFGAILVFAALRPLGLTLAQSVFICVLCPTATAAPVVTGMLGGDIAKVATYSIVSNLAVAILAPVLFVVCGNLSAHADFVEEFLSIAMRVAPIIVFPLLAAFTLYFVCRPVHTLVNSVQGVSFYLWSVALIVVVGRAVSFILAEPPSAVPLMLAMSALALLVCLLQFCAGRIIGRRYGDAVSGAQGLGQKNTVLAIWMSLAYLDPLASIGPASYIVWQNTINSAQLYYRMKQPRHRVAENK